MTFCFYTLVKRNEPEKIIIVCFQP